MTRMSESSKKANSGQAIIEYIIVLSIAVVMALAVTQGILAAFDRGVLKFGAGLEKNLKTGRHPIRVWEN